MLAALFDRAVPAMLAGRKLSGVLLIGLVWMLTGCATLLSRTGEEVSMLTEDVLTGIPNATGRVANQVLEQLAGYDDAALADVLRDAMREAITGVGQGLELGEGPLNEEITAFVERIAQSVVRGAVDQLEVSEIDAQITLNIDAAMNQLSRNIGEDIRPEVEALVRGVARNAAQELLATISAPESQEQVNGAIRAFTATMTGEVQRLLNEDVRRTADGIAIDMGRALRSELVEPTMSQLDVAVAGWIDEIDDAVSEGFRQANSVLRVLSSVLGGILMIVLGILLWVARARAALANELRMAAVEKDRLEMAIASMARVFAESWSTIDRLENSPGLKVRPEDVAVRTFLQAQLNEVRNSTAGIARVDSEGEGMESLIKTILKARGREDWLVNYNEFDDGPGSFEEWVWRRFSLERSE